MLGQVEVGLGLLLVMATVIALAATADDIALGLTADGIGNARLVVLFVDLEHLPRSLEA